MKNILKNMSQEEKQAILEQHKGGKTINTEKFSKLLESKLGDVKPITEQRIEATYIDKTMKPVSTDTKMSGGTSTKMSIEDMLKKLGQKPTPEQKKELEKKYGMEGKMKEFKNEQATETPSKPTTNTTDTVKDKKITALGDVTGDLKGKTVNFYEDEANKYLRFTLKIIKIIKEEAQRLQIVMDWGTSGGQGENPDYFYFFCEDGNFITKRGSEQETFFSNNFAKELKKRFCDVSAGGAEVPAADFVQP